MEDEIDNLLEVMAGETKGGLPEDLETKTEAPKSESQESEEAPAETPKEESPEAPKTEEPSKTETQTPAETEVEEIDWKATLPPAPQVPQLLEPEVNENGEITNMNPAQYNQYIIEKAKAEMRQETYHATLETKALEAAEQILPEMKTNPVIRTLVQNTRVASILNGEVIDSYEAAKQVRQALGQARSEGAQSAKVSIETQTAAQIQTNGSTEEVASKTMDKDLQRRLSRGDTDAFSELMDAWQEEGKV